MFKSCVVTEKIREKSRICSSNRFQRLSRHYRDPPDLSSFIESSESISHSALTFANLFPNTTDETFRWCSYARGNLLASCSAAISTELAGFMERCARNFTGFFASPPILGEVQRQKAFRQIGNDKSRESPDVNNNNNNNNKCIEHTDVILR